MFTFPNPLNKALSSSQDMYPDSTGVTVGIWVHVWPTISSLRMSIESDVADAL